MTSFSVVSLIAMVPVSVRGAQQDLGNRVADSVLGAAWKRAKHIGGIADQRLDAIFRDLFPKRAVERIANNGRLVDLKVARVDQAANRRVDHKACAFGDRVRDWHVGDFQRAAFDNLWVRFNHRHNAIR